MGYYRSRRYKPKGTHPGKGSMAHLVSSTPQPKGVVSSISSAADPRLAAVSLPSHKADIQRGQLLEDVFDSTRRRGAKTDYAKANFLGLKPAGEAPGRILDEQFSTGRAPKPERPFSKEFDLDGKGDKHPEANRQSVGIILPRNFCPDCGRTNRPYTGGAINPAYYEEDRPDLHVKAFRLVISFFCQECVENYALAQTDRAGELSTAHFAGGSAEQQAFNTSTVGDHRAAERLVKVKKNKEDFIRARILCDDKSIFPNGDPYAA